MRLILLGFAAGFFGTLVFVSVVLWLLFAVVDRPHPRLWFWLRHPYEAIVAGITHGETGPG